MDDSFLIFDRKRKRLQRQRAAKQPEGYRFLIHEAALRLADRLEDITRQFPVTVLLGNHGDVIAPLLPEKAGIHYLLHCDNIAIEPPANFSSPEILAVCGDEEILPFAEDSCDAVIALFNLHWVNDLPGTLVQIRRILKPDGLFLAIFPGGDTLKELRQAVTQAAIQLETGLTPRVSPFVDVRDAGMLLQRAGFALPVVDSETLTVSYSDAFKLMDDLRGMGESNALLKQQKSFTRREMLITIAEEYQQAFRDEKERITATFELITLTAWKPHTSQQKSAPRGSGQVSLNQVLTEKP
jgi:SAM-dependent methyltransferase